MRGSRGTSLLVTLFIVAITGLTSVVSDFGDFTSDNQLAQATTATKNTEVKDDIASKQWQDPSTKKQYAIHYACSQKGDVGKIQKLVQQCRQGFKMKVETSQQLFGLDASLRPNLGTVKVTPTPTNPCPNGAPESETQCSVGTRPVKSCVEQGTAPSQCQLELCDTKSCKGVPVPDIDNALKQLQSPAVREQLAKALGMPAAGLDQLMKMLGQGAESGRPDLEAASRALAEEQAQIAEANKNIQQQSQIELDVLAGCDATPESDLCKGASANLAALEAAEKANAERARQLEEQQKALADAQKKLSPTESGGGPCQYGGFFPNCHAAPAPGDSNKNKTNTTFPDPRSIFGGGQNPLGSLGQLLKGLGGGGGGAPAAGNQTPKAPGTCAAGQTLCQGNTLYSRNNQCVDTVVQVCQYGCSGNQCVQQGQQCPPPPSQPDPARCAGGSWRPTYNGVCVGNWQCVGGTDEIVAQLSCQPQIADVGMSVAISYSCSMGTSVGSGFETNGAPSGATSVSVAAPPGASNRATYALTCSYQGKTTTKECSVQVAKPSIVLVTNPKTVDTGKSAMLGWVTSGMQACVVSSPDLPAFTSENATRTNVNGTTLTPTLTNEARFLLRCTTLGGSVREATTTVSIRN